ncbi:MAG: efflux RND transporter periplasmic adaptor subunit [Bacillota bacterium]
MQELNKLVVILILIMLVITGCAGVPEGEKEVQPKPVKVLVLEEETYPIVLEYIGNVAAKEVIHYSFKLPGKIARIYVEEGMMVKKDQLLAALDTEDISLAIKASENNLEKAQNYFDHLTDTYNRVQRLYDEGAVTKQELEEIILKLTTAELDLRNAGVDYDNKLKLLGDSQIVSDMDGYVLKVLSKESEIVGSGYPVIVIRGIEQVVTIGVSSQDALKISKGMAAQVIVDAQKTRGTVTDLAHVPDEQTRTYKAEIEIENSFPLGAFASAEIEIGEDAGILIPITAVMTKGNDYVYIVDAHDRVEKRPITIKDIRGERVSVEGVGVGEKLVIEGMRQLEDGDLVRVIE